MKQWALDCEMIFYSTIISCCYIICVDSQNPFSTLTLLWVTGKTSCLDHGADRVLFCNSRLQCVNVPYDCFSVDNTNFNI